MRQANSCTGTQWAQQGVSLFELLISLIIGGILAATAVPSFARMIQKSQIEAKVGEIQSVLRLSRTHAIANNVQVTLCRLGESPCTRGGKDYRDWSSGWFVFEDDNANEAHDEGEQIIASTRVNPEKYSIRLNNLNPYFFFKHTGEASSSANITVCRSSDTERRRSVSILWSGRSRLDTEQETRERGKVCRRP